MDQPYQILVLMGLGEMKKINLKAYKWTILGGNGAMRTKTGL